VLHFPSISGKSINGMTRVLNTSGMDSIFTHTCVKTDDSEGKCLWNATYVRIKRRSECSVYGRSC
jgi:hypothetical protein